MQKQSANPSARMAPKRNFFMICSPDAKTVQRVRKLFERDTEMTVVPGGELFPRHNSSTLFRIYLSIRRAKEICTNVKLRRERSTRSEKRKAETGNRKPETGNRVNLGLPYGILRRGRGLRGDLVRFCAARI